MLKVLLMSFSIGGFLKQIQIWKQLSVEQNELKFGTLVTVHGVLRPEVQGHVRVIGCLITRKRLVVEKRSGIWILGH